MSLSFHILLVPQGAEYQAVCGGLKPTDGLLMVLPIPAGPVAVRQKLRELHQQEYFANQPNILVMGLCGSLSPCYAVGDVVLYQRCVRSPLSAPDSPLSLLCDRSLTSRLQKKLGNVSPVKALTSDRVICSATEKRSLAQTADVVDMEGYAVLEFFNPLQIPVAMIRVISDDCDHDLPDVSNAFNADGSLQLLPLALGMVRQPMAAMRLIRGSLKGLTMLQNLASNLV